MKISSRLRYNEWIEIKIESGNTIIDETIHFNAPNTELIKFISDLKECLNEAEYLLENGK